MKLHYKKIQGIKIVTMEYGTKINRGLIMLMRFFHKRCSSQGEIKKDLNMEEI